MDNSQQDSQGQGPSSGPSDAIVQAAAQAQQMLSEIRAHLSAAQAAMVAAAESQGQASAIVTQATSTLATAKAVASQVDALVAKLTEREALTAEHERQIKEAQQASAKVGGEMAIALSSLAAVAAEVETHKTSAKIAAENSVELFEKAQESSKKIGEDDAAVTASRIASKQSETLLAGMAEKAADANARVKEYEDRLTELQSQSSDQLDTIVGLLPGATSAGLASAFDARRMTFTDPTRRWQWIFIGSVGLLTLLAISGLKHVYDSTNTLTYDELFRLWLARLPIAAALLWLAIHASRESALAKRLEEDYGYKAAVAASFLGFNKQLSYLTDKTGQNIPLATLCSDTLATIASPPGRIYDKHQLTVTPTDEFKSLVKDFLGQISGTKPAPKD